MSGEDFFQSEQEAILREVWRLDGSEFIEIGFSFLEDPETWVRRTRVKLDSIYPQPEPGDRIRLEFLMGSVNQVTRIHSVPE